MRRLKLLVSYLFFSSFILYCDAASYITIRPDSQRQKESIDISASQLSAFTLRVLPLNNGEAMTLTTNDHAILGYGTNWDNSASMVIINGSTITASNMFLFSVAASNVPQSGSYFYQILQTNSLTNSSSVLGHGLLQLAKSPITGPYTALNLQTILNWDQVLNLNAGPWVLTNSAEWIQIQSDSDTAYLNSTNAIAIAQNAASLAYLNDGSETVLYIQETVTTNIIVTPYGGGSLTPDVSGTYYFAGGQGTNRSWTNGSYSSIYAPYGEGAAWKISTHPALEHEWVGPGSTIEPTNALYYSPAVGASGDAVVKFALSTNTMAVTSSYLAATRSSATNAEAQAQTAQAGLAIVTTNYVKRVPTSGGVTNVAMIDGGGYLVDSLYPISMQADPLTVAVRDGFGDIYGHPIGSGALITNLNASELRSGTIPLARNDAVVVTNLSTPTLTAAYKSSTNASSLDNEYTIRKELIDLRASLLGTTIFGATNVNPLLAARGGTNYLSFHAALPSQAWTNTFSLPSNGVFNVGNRYMTNSITSIGSGTYNHNVHANVNAAGTVGYYYSTLYVAIISGGNTNFVMLGTNGTAVFPTTTINEDDSSIYLATNMNFSTASNVTNVLGVQRTFVRTAGNSGSSMSIYGGGIYDTHLQFPSASGSATGTSVDDTTHTNTMTFGITNALSTNFTSTTTSFIRGQDLMGSFYVANTNGWAVPSALSQVVRLSLYSADSFACDTLYLQADCVMSAVKLSSNAVPGDTNIWVGDTTPFSVDQSIYLDGSSNEFKQVKSIDSATKMTLWCPLLGHHTSNEVVSIRRVFNHPFRNSVGSSRLYLSISSTNNLSGEFTYQATR